MFNNDIKEWNLALNNEPFFPMSDADYAADTALPANTPNPGYIA